MRECREELPVGYWVIVSTERCQGLSDFQLQPCTPRLHVTLFCPGHAAITPHAVLAYRTCQTASNASGWTVRPAPPAKDGAHAVRRCRRGARLKPATVDATMESTTYEISWGIRTRSGVEG